MAALYVNYIQRFGNVIFYNVLKTTGSSSIVSVYYYGEMLEQSTVSASNSHKKQMQTN